MSLPRAVLVALVALSVPVSGARAAGWTAPVAVAHVPDVQQPDSLFVGMGPTGVPFASWFEKAPGTLHWTQEGPAGWTSPIVVPGDVMGGF